jgi:hypothetical protein
MLVSPRPFHHGLDRGVAGSVATALLVVLAAQGAYDGVVSVVAATRSDPGTVPDFQALLGTTLLMSITLTVAIAALTLPPYFGQRRSWRVPSLVTASGGCCSLLTAAAAADTTIGPHALTGYAQQFPVAFAGAIAVGVAGGLVTLATAEHALRADRVPL